MNYLLSRVGDLDLAPFFHETLRRRGQQSQAVAKESLAAAVRRRRIAMEDDVMRYPAGKSAIPMKGHLAVGVQVILSLRVHAQVINHAEIPLLQLADRTAEFGKLVVHQRRKA